MMRTSFQNIVLLLLGCGLCTAQNATVGMPDSLVIARHTFFDFGPPFNYYELIRVMRHVDGLSVERALMTPPGQACLQPATVESKAVILHNTMADLLTNKNPCAIPEKELHRELKRCKKCLTFSGVIITLQVNCGGKDRQLRMDILDKDLFDSRPQTPENTSWTMSLLGELDKALGPGAMDKPMFSLGSTEQSRVPDTVLEADKPPPPPPSVEIESVTPFAPISPKLPIYPRIAKAARVEGLVTITFDVSADGKVENIVLVNGPKMVELGVKDAVTGWSFPQSAWGKSGQAAIRFALNCKAGPS